MWIAVFSKADEVIILPCTKNRSPKAFDDLAGFETWFEDRYVDDYVVRFVHLTNPADPGVRLRFHEPSVEAGDDHEPSDEFFDGAPASVAAALLRKSSD